MVMLHGSVFQFLAGRRCETRGGNHMTGGVLLHGSVIHIGRIDCSIRCNGANFCYRSLQTVSRCELSSMTTVRIQLS